MADPLSMSTVAECLIAECVYNRGSRCLARAITIGNGEHPECLTVHCHAGHVPKQAVRAGVGACKVKRCLHNRDYHCTAERVYIAYSGNEVACQSFRPS